MLFAVCSKTHVAAHEKNFIRASNAKNELSKTINGKEPILLDVLKSTSSRGSPETSMSKKGPSIAGN